MGGRAGARADVSLHLADRLRPDLAYRRSAERAQAPVLGGNHQGSSYVTGYLVGGPWPTARDWFDVEEDYRMNEIAINWNAALVYMLAAFVEPAGRR